MIIANSINATKDPILIKEQKAMELFPNNSDIKNIYCKLRWVHKNESISYSKTGLDYFNKGDHISKAKQFELAIESNPLIMLILKMQRHQIT